MTFFAAIFNVLLAIITFFWHRLLEWLTLFAAPFQNFSLLWLIIPVYLSWAVTELFQEKQITSFGNAITNGIVPIWAAIDWTRYITEHSKGYTPFEYGVKIALCILIFIYGAAIIYHGIKAKNFVHYFGRIREVTYVILVFTPIIYNIVPLSWNYTFGIVFFFPVFYFSVEWLDKRMPNPYAVQKDMESPTSKENAEQNIQLHTTPLQTHSPEIQNIQQTQRPTRTSYNQPSYTTQQQAQYNQPSYTTQPQHTIQTPYSSQQPQTQYSSQPQDTPHPIQSIEENYTTQTPNITPPIPTTIPITPPPAINSNFSIPPPAAQPVNQVDYQEDRYKTILKRLDNKN